MSVQKIPNTQKKWVQSNKGDYDGNVWSTFCMDFDTSPGVAQPSKPLEQILGASKLGSDIVQALTIHDGNYTVTTNSSVFTCSVNNDPTDASNWSSVATLGVEDLGLESDSTSFAGLQLFSLGTDIMSWTGSVKDDDWWTVTVSGTALTANKPHTLEVLRTGNDTLFVTDGNKVRYYNSAAGHTTITLESFFTADVLIPALDKMWVGTYTEVENNAYVYEIQVGNDTATQSYPVDGLAVLTGFLYKNTPFVITERGYIQVFNGAGFETIAQFPFAFESKVIEGVRPGLVQDSSTSRAIHPKGAQVKGKHVYIFVNMGDEYNGGSLINQRSYSGVWVLDLETYALSHRYAPRLEGVTNNGWSKVTRSGPLLLTNTPETRIMVGTEIDTNGEGVFMEGTSTPYGWFTTLRHEAESIADVYEKFVVKADTPDTTDTVDVFYKNSNRPDFPLHVDDVTWLNANQFTTSNALTNVVVGDSIFITGGHYAGYTTTISAVSGSTTKTVTVTDNIGTQNETSDVQIDNWQVLDDQYVSGDGEWKTLGAGDDAHTFTQYKVEMSGDVVIRETISKSNNKEGL